MCSTTVDREHRVELFVSRLSRQRGAVISRTHSPPTLLLRLARDTVDTTCTSLHNLGDTYDPLLGIRFLSDHFLQCGHFILLSTCLRVMIYCIDALR
ncbi:hypothetical protein Mapa_004511 [Marchantia paleacea]|nr:hypothetical protein Mapa_004511 [Marchantia paleacea]